MNRSAFTLIELVVVVLLLGILAAVAAPRLINNSDQAVEVAIAQNLVSIREAIGLYEATYRQLPPGTLAGCDLPAALDEFLRGPTFPTGANHSNQVKNVVGRPRVQPGNFGWVYSIDQGEVIINASEAAAVDVKLVHELDGGEQ